MSDPARSPGFTFSISNQKELICCPFALEKFGRLVKKIGSPVKILRNMFCKNLPLHRLPLDGDVGQGWLCILMMSRHMCVRCVTS